MHYHCNTTTTARHARFDIPVAEAKIEYLLDHREYVHETPKQSNSNCVQTKWKYCVLQSRVNATISKCFFEL